MPVNVTSVTRAGLYAQETQEIWIALIEITHPLLSQPIRVCSDAKNVYSNGKTFIAYPFELQLPSSTATEVPKASIKIDNVDQDIMFNLRSINTPPNISFSIVRAGNPNLIEVSYPNFILNSVQYDALTITGDISVEQYMTEPYPKDTYTPGRFPGLYGLVVPTWPSATPGKP